MLPFCGYHMADYFRHWLEIGKRGDAAKLPKIFYVNWFRKDAGGHWLWPGFGENSRVIAWAFRRCDDAAEAEETPIGLVPTADSLDLEGLDISEDHLADLLRVDASEWRDELPSIHEHFAKFGEHLPTQLRKQLETLERQVGGAG